MWFFWSVHCGSMRQTATIIHMDKDHLRTGDKAMVRFRFIKQPEFVKPETRMIFREGRTKAVGTIQQIDPTAHPPPQVGGKVKHRGPGRGTAQSRDKSKDGASAQASTSSERTGKKWLDSDVVFSYLIPFLRFLRSYLISFNIVFLKFRNLGPLWSLKILKFLLFLYFLRSCVEDQAFVQNSSSLRFDHLLFLIQSKRKAVI